jgi:integrase/recombinase XerC
VLGCATRLEARVWYPRQDSNLCTRLRRPVLYPLSYGGNALGAVLNLDSHPYFGKPPLRSTCLALVRTLILLVSEVKPEFEGEGQVQATKQAASTWTFYQLMFTDALEAQNAATRTIETYELAVQQLGEFLRVQGMPDDPTRVTREHLTEWMRFLVRERSPATANQRYRSISRFFKFLVEQDERRDNPMAKMSPPKIPEKEVPVIREQGLKKLFRGLHGADFESRRDRAIFSLFIDCGLRVTEMANLNAADVDLEEREVIVHQGKGRKPRRLRFTRETRQDLQRYWLVRQKHPHAHDRALWIGKRGRMVKSGVYRMVVRRTERAGLGHVHPHMLRHSLAHYYRMAGGGDDELMRLMGWSSREMLSRYGSSVAAERSRERHDDFSPRKGL